MSSIDFPNQALNFNHNNHSTPVWTAFVTHNLGKRSWLKSYDSRTVIVRDIRSVIFMSMDDYNPPQTPQGHHILEFEKSRGKWLYSNQISSYC